MTMRILLSFALITALTTIALPATANHPDGFGMPDQAMWGLCNAYENNQNGRENGKAGNASPFHWMQEQADEAEEESVEAWCEQYEKPGNGRGPPEDRGRP